MCLIVRHSLNMHNIIESNGVSCNENVFNQLADTKSFIQYDLDMLRYVCAIAQPNTANNNQKKKEQKLDKTTVKHVKYVNAVQWAYSLDVWIFGYLNSFVWTMSQKTILCIRAEQIHRLLNQCYSTFLFLFSFSLLVPTTSFIAIERNGKNIGQKGNSSL